MTEENRRNWASFSNELVRGGVSVAECRTTDDAQFLAYLLSERGIRSGILVPGDKMDLRLPQIKVAPEHEELARRILAEPVPAGTREDYDAAPEIDVPPHPCCPACRSDEVVLDGIESGNQWRCEHCGKAWTEIVCEPQSGS